LGIQKAANALNSVEQRGLAGHLVVESIGVLDLDEEV